MTTATTAPADRPPASEIEIGTFPLNGRDTVRAALSEFNGQSVVNFRKWYRDGDGTAKPTRKGIAFAVRHLPAFAALVNDALARVCADGLLNDGGENGRD